MYLSIAVSFLLTLGVFSYLVFNISNYIILWTSIWLLLSYTTPMLFGSLVNVKLRPAEYAEILRGIRIDIVDNNSRQEENTQVFEQWPLDVLDEEPVNEKPVNEEEINEKEIKNRKNNKITKKECCVCMDADPNVVLLPCRHMSICDNCSKQVEKCPLCRKLITKRMVVYV